MKIVIIPSWFNSPKSPSRGSFISAQARGLSRRGHQVTMIIPDRDAKSPFLSVSDEMEDGFRHLRISVPSPWHRLIGFYAPGVLASVIRENVQRLRPDVVHAHAVRPAGVLAEYAMRGLDTPWCLTEHSGPLRAFWWTAHGKAQIARAYANASRLFAVSDSLRREMVNYFGSAASKASVLYNGIDTDLFSPQLPFPGHGRLIFVGGLEPKKGLGILFRALSRLPSIAAWTLTIVGKGRLEKSLRSDAASLGIADRIHWLGSAPHNEMPKIYAEHDVLVVPSIHETFSLVCAEALACGRPVIATRCGGPEEVVPPFGGMLVTPNDPNALAAALKSALSNSMPFESQLAMSYIHNKFSMSVLLDRLEQTYSELTTNVT